MDIESNTNIWALFSNEARKRLQPSIFAIDSLVMKDQALKSLYKILKSYAVKVIKKHNPFVIAITGSVGKTSTKEALLAILSEAYGKKVRATAGNLNAEIGIPLTILGYNSYPSKWLWLPFLLGAYFKTFTKIYPQYLILEMGVEHPGDIEYFGSIVKPNIVIITAATPAHTANFESVEKMQAEKLSAKEIIKKDGLVVINADDKYLSKQKFESAVNYSINNESNNIASDIEIKLTGNSYRLKSSAGVLNVNSNLVGKQSICSELAAITVAKVLKIDSKIITSGLSKLKQYPGRVQIINGIKNSTIIDDTYNSNPASAMAALDLLSEIKTKNRKIVILGNMNELGEIEKEAHIELGAYANSRCDIALFSGQNAENMQQGFNDKKRSKVFKNREELIFEMNNFIYKGDIILVKASQNGNYFEEVVKFLMKDKSKAEELLVRQSAFWMNKKIS